MKAVFYILAAIVLNALPWLLTARRRGRIRLCAAGNAALIEFLIAAAVLTAYNAALKSLGDESPDFISAVSDLTAEGCAALGLSEKPYDGIYCQSVGSHLKKAAGGTFPMNFSYHMVKYFDGQNDGLVSVDSMRWGEKFTLVEPSGKRGISHADVIDGMRENIKGFDVREFYVGLVSDLKERGL